MTVHHNDNNQGSNDGPVAVIVIRKAKKGKGSEFEEWMDSIIHEAIRFERHIGVNIIRPSDLSNPEYLLIFRFNTYENLTKWERSEIRKEWQAKSKEVAEGEPIVQKQIGLELWFTPHAGTGNINGDKAPGALPPLRYKMAILMTGIIFILLNIAVPQILQLTMGLPNTLSTLAGVAIMVLFMNYVIMPSLTKLLRPWLAKKSLI